MGGCGEYGYKPLYLGVMRAHGTCALVWAPRVALVRIWECVILHLIIPRLDVERWRSIPEGEKAAGIRMFW